MRYGTFSQYCWSKLYPMQEIFTSQFLKSALKVAGIVFLLLVLVNLS